MRFQKRLAFGRVRVRVAAGPHDVGVTFFRRNRAQSDEPLQLHERHHDLQDMNGLPIVEQVKMVLDGTMNPRDIAPHLTTDDDTPQGERTTNGQAGGGGAKPARSQASYR